MSSRHVLLNARHHTSSRGRHPRWIDPFSSAAWFDGWARPVDRRLDGIDERVRQSAPTAAASVWLLTDGWRLHGAITFDEIEPDPPPR